MGKARNRPGEDDKHGVTMGSRPDLFYCDTCFKEKPRVGKVFLEIPDPAGGALVAWICSDCHPAVVAAVEASTGRTLNPAIRERPPEPRA